MKKILLFISLYPVVVLSQTNKPFKIIGSSDFYNNKEVTFAPALFFDTVYLDNNIKIRTITIRNNKFGINGNLKYPTPFSFNALIKEENRPVASDWLFIEEGNINITLNDFEKDSGFGNKLNSKSNNEYQKLKGLYKHLESENDLRRIEPKNIEAKDKILQSYIKNYPNSYVAMWILILDYKNFGYSKLIDSISTLFSKNIKTTKAFKAFITDLKADRELTLSNKFPFYKFSFGKQLSKNVQSSHYTLIDFWASWCKPCVVQLPDFVKIFRDYHSKGFVIYGISIDRQVDIKRMQKVIAEKGVNWSNILDDNGKEAKKINVTGIPRNFLLDPKGKIISKDLSAVEIETFLRENLPLK